MKTVSDFWKAIETYNVETISTQGIFTVILIGILLFSFFRQNQLVEILIKIVFSVVFIYLGIYFFMIIDKSFTSKIFGPYFIIIGLLFLIGLLDSKSQLQPSTPVQYLFYGIALSYPIISYLLDHKFPHQVLYILPCPIASIALITYCRFKKRNDVLNIMLIIWGLTGVKAIIFDVKEDLILLMIGVYGLIDFINYKRKKTS